MIYYGHQHITNEDIEAVREVLTSEFLTQGPAVERFEQSVSGYCGAAYAVAVTNATAALHIACQAAGLGKGDVLWTSPVTFVASANCARYCGADVDFVDIDDKTYNMSVAALEKKLKTAKKLPKVVVPVHLAGQSCAMQRIWELSREYGFTVIEDASHAIGGSYQNDQVGSCTYSDMTVFSFHPVKIITTGEGGMVLTNRQELCDALQLYRSHGITRDPSRMTRGADEPWYYEQIALGCNYRMTDLQAALGASQMTKLDAFVARRRQLVQRYHEKLNGLPIRTPYCLPEANPAWHLYIVRLDLDHVKKSKQEIFAGMKEHGVMLNLHYIPVHLQPYYRDLGFGDGDFPVSEQYYREALTLPLYYDLTDAQQDAIIAALRDVLA